MELLQRLNLVAGAPRFLRAVPDADHLDLVAFGFLGPQGLAEAAAIMVNQPGGGGENMRGGAVILLQLDHLGVGEILLEAQDIGDFRAAPGIDGLVVVADAADILVALGEQAQPEILRAVGILIFVDQDIFEPLLKALQDLPVCLQQIEDMEQ